MTVWQADAVRKRLQEVFDRKAADPDWIPDEFWIKAHEAISKTIGTQHKVMAALEEVARRKAGEYTARELEAQLRRELENFVVDVLSDDEFLVLATRRAGTPVALVPQKEVLDVRQLAAPEPAQEQDEINDWMEGDPEQW